MRIRKQLLYLFATLLCSISCTEETLDPFSNRILFLTNNDTKNWSTVSIESDDPIEGINCEEDDVLTLTIFDYTLQDPGPSFSKVDGLVRCDYTLPYVVNSGSWRLNNAQTRIILTRVFSDGSRINDLVDILELEDRKMVLRFRDETDLKITFTTYTYESL